MQEIQYPCKRRERRKGTNIEKLSGQITFSGG